MTVRTMNYSRHQSHMFVFVSDEAPISLSRSPGLSELIDRGFSPTGSNQVFLIKVHSSIAIIKYGIVGK